MRCCSISRIGASAGSSASSVFQRWTAAGLSPAAKRGGAEIEQRQRVAGLGLLEALQHGDRLGRGRRAGRELADMGLGPVGQEAGIDRAQRIGLGVGVGGGGVVAQDLPGVGEAQPAGAVLRVLLHLGGQALDHAADRLLALLRRHRGHRLLLLARRLGHAGRRRRKIRIEAGRLGDALDLGPQHGQEGRVGRAFGQELAPARERGAAVAALRLVQAEIIEGARIVGPGSQRLGERLDGGPGHRAVGLERQRLAQARRAPRDRRAARRGARARRPEAFRRRAARRWRRAPACRRRTAPRAGRGGRPADRGRAPAAG